MNDALLLQKYAASRDAEALAEIVRRYAGMVYGACLRITRNAHDAEDAAQECFLELARAAGSVQKPGPWLHGVAIHKARNAVRAATTRNRHEEQAMPETREEPTWNELAPHVDRAIEELSGDLRDVVVQHYLRGLTQAQTAEALGVNQSTVSRRLDQAVQQLRENLRKVGVVASVAALGAILTQNASAAAPASLTAALGKLAIAGVGKAGAGAGPAGTTAGILGTVAGKVAAIAASVAAVVAVGVVVSQHATRTPPPPVANVEPANKANGGTDVSPKTLQPNRYSKLDLKGQHWRDDSFSIVMREVARLYGREADYATIFALSGNAFSPSWVTEKDFCRATGRMFGKEKNIGLVARFLGLNARKLAFPEPPPKPEPDAQGRTWGTPPFNDWLRKRNAQCAAVIRQSLDAGETVVANGGWLNYEWFVWGVITEVRPDGTIVGQTLGPPLTGTEGYCFMDHIEDYWAIAPAAERLPQKDADLAMLRSVVESLRGAPPYEPGRIVYGLAAMDLWIAQMNKPSFQEDDPGSSAGNARVNADVSVHGAEVASEYLRRRLDTFPEPIRSTIEAAARNYTKIAELLRPFTGPVKDGQGYGAMMGAPAKQKAHADTVLKPVRGELAAAAEAMEKALAAPAVRREGDRVWIEGVERLRFGEGRDNQFIATMTVTLRAMGEPVDYDTLMGYSGAAFRLHFWDKELCPSSPDLLGGFNHGVPAAEAFGYRIEVINCESADGERQQALRKRITASIDHGVPVISNNLMGHGSYEVIAGYENGGAVLLARAYDNLDNSYSPGRSWPSTLVFLVRKEPPLAPRTAILRSLGIAVELAETASYQRGGTQFSGFAAYDRWVAELKKEEEFRKFPVERNTYLADANGWIYLALADARAAAARYVRRIAGDSEGAVAGHLRTAAERYEQIQVKLVAGQRYAPASWQLPGDRWSKHVPHPEAAPVAGWTSEMRQGESDVLRECQAIERSAVAEIKAALAALRVSRVDLEGGKVSVEGVPVLASGQGKEDTMTSQSVSASLLMPGELKNWRLTAWQPNGRMWALDNGVFHGFCSNTWVGYSEHFKDLLLECEVLYDGYGGGDICVRGNRDADKTWDHGYNFAIGPSQDRTRGRIILTNPKGHHEACVEFKVNEWSKLRISAVGGTIQAYVKPDERLSFVDKENRFPSGQICLSDQSCQKGDNCQCDGSGHIKFRNLVVSSVARDE